MNDSELNNLDVCYSLGRGSQTVYVYYYPEYRKLDSGQWPCKIGMTKRKLQTRLTEQIKTALPEKAIVGLILHTTNAYDVEQILHHMLHLYDRKCNNAPGEEWYWTSPMEIRSICEILKLA